MKRTENRKQRALLGPRVQPETIRVSHRISNKTKGGEREEDEREDERKQFPESRAEVDGKLIREHNI